MKKSIFILLPLLIIAINIFAQEENKMEEFGLYYDINGNELDNFCDFDYRPEDVLRIAVTEDYNFGFYYDLSGIKIEGLIKRISDNSGIFYKKDSGSEEIKLKPDLIIGFKTGSDSFTIIKNYEIERPIGPKTIKDASFAEVISDRTKFTIYKLEKNTGFGEKKYYFIKSDTTKILPSFSKHYTDKFQEMVLKYFGDCPVIKMQISEGNYKISRMPAIIKFYEYFQKYLNKKAIYYSGSWDEINDSSTASFYGNILNITDTVWEIKYFSKSGIPIYLGHFTSFVPITRNGEFTWFYSNGAPRKKIVYNNNEIEGSVTENFMNSKTHYVYNLKKEKRFYLSVLDSTGRNVLDAKGNGNENFYDPRGRKIMKRYKSNRLFLSGYTDASGNNVFQFCGENATMNSFDRYQNKMSDKIKYPKESQKNQNHGIMLISFIIDTFGNATNLKIIKSVDTICDKLILNYLKAEKTKPSWTPAKFHNLSCYQEIVLPVYFQLSGITNERPNFYYYNYWWMHQPTFPPKFDLPPPPKINPPPPRFR